MTDSQGFLGRLRARLNRGDSWLTRDVRELLPAGGQVDEASLEELETRLLLADTGVDATRRIITSLESRIRSGRVTGAEGLLEALAVELRAILEPCSAPLVIDREAKPFVILMTGVNGAGKTTTIGKLARRYRDAGLSVMLAAGDTFRAAAVEQLVAWGERNDVPVVSQSHGADPAAVAYDAMQAARARDVDVLIVDTAGRLHTRSNLMEELKKVHRVLGKAGGGAPHEVMLVVDATAGQNALAQAVEFNAAVPLTGITMTKLDGTARGGIIFAIAERLGVPIRYIGVGEQAGDLGEFDAAAFVDALLARGVS